MSSQPTLYAASWTNQIAFNTKIQRSDQPNGGANVRVNGTFKLLLNGKLVFSRVFQLNNYESTPIFQETFSGLTKGEYVVTFQAFYETGSISDSVNVAEQSWWA